MARLKIIKKPQPADIAAFITHDSRPFEVIETAEFERAANASVGELLYDSERRAGEIYLYEAGVVTSVRTSPDGKQFVKFVTDSLMSDEAEFLFRRLSEVELFSGTVLIAGEPSPWDEGDE